VFLTSIVTQESTNDVWFLDSGCSNHMTGNKDLFSSIDTSIQSEVKLRNDCKVTVNGKGVVPVYTKDNQKINIDDVYFVPCLKCNLISVGQLMEKKYKVFFKNKVCTIYNKFPSKQLIARVEMIDNRIFPLVMRNDLSGSLNDYKAESLDESWLWHLTYGHLHFGGLDLLHRRQMVKGFPYIQQPPSSCESCILGKHQKEKFVSRVSYRAKAPLEIVHMDLCGPMQTPYLIGSVYFMTFIDDFSRKTWLYLLKLKSEAFEAFKRFKSMDENDSGRTIKILRFDRGGEYKLNEFIEFFDSHGIKR
jgi:hypothetical protein